MAGEARRHLFLAVKEALNNVVKHAKASQVVLKFCVGEAQVEISIEDNGCGFATEPSPATGLPSVKPRVSGGNGLRNLRERVEAIGGRCVIHSAAETGTAVWLAVPLRQALR